MIGMERPAQQISLNFSSGSEFGVQARIRAEHSRQRAVPTIIVL